MGISLAFYSFIVLGVLESSYGVLLPSIIATFNLNSATITSLFLSQFIGYIGAALVSSSQSNHVGYIRMLLLASIVLIFALAIYITTPIWPLMIAGGVLLGSGMGLIDVSSNTYIANDVDNADTIGYLHGFYGIGALLGPAIATSLLNTALNWRLAYLIFIWMVVLLALGTLFSEKRNYVPLVKQKVEPNTNTWQHLREVLCKPVVFISAFFLLVYVGTEASIGYWAYSFQTLIHDIPKIQAGYSVSAYWMGLTLGRMGMRRMVRTVGAIRTTEFSLIILIIGLLFWWFVPSQLISLPIMGLALAAIYPTIILLASQSVPTRSVSSTVGFLSSVGNLGSAIFPTSVGIFSTWIGLKNLPIMMLSLSILMILLNRWLIRERIVCD
ncbi:MAG: MFS transporter [Stenomitos rutilans HA7619-LM2]|jgi:fucose permease|nr:MFS transporter [Stenomitos rutilans HA7619-LM2]